MLFTKKGFTLVEMMVAVLLSAIVIFFSYTMTISAYKMFSKTSKTAQNFNNIQFFEEVLKKSITEADRIDLTGDSIRCRRSDPHLNNYVTDIYTFENPASDTKFLELYGSHFDSYPSNITDSDMFAPKNLRLKSVPDGSSESASPDILVLSNVRAFFYRPNKIGGANNHLKNITIGIVYEDRVMSISRRQNRTFCFTLRNQNGNIFKNGGLV